LVSSSKAAAIAAWTVETTAAEVLTALGVQAESGRPTLTNSDNGRFLVVVEIKNNKVVAAGQSSAINITGQQFTEPTVTIGEGDNFSKFRDALNSGIVETIHVNIGLRNVDADITIPQGKTVIFGTIGELYVRNLTVNGTMISESIPYSGRGALVAIAGQLSGSGLKANQANGFFGTDAEYAVREIMWIEAGTYMGQAYSVTETGWWPISVVVNTQTALAAAIDKMMPNGSISSMHQYGNLEIPKSFDIRNLHINGSLTIPSGVTVTLSYAVDILRDGTLTVDGALNGNNDPTQSGSDSFIFIRHGGTLNLNGAQHLGPSEAELSSHGDYYSIVRCLRWVWGGTSWGSPYLYNRITDQAINPSS
jgi:hypothetical protein